MKTSLPSKNQQTSRTTPVPPELNAWLHAVNGLPLDQIEPIPGGDAPPLLSDPWAGISPVWAARARKEERLREQRIRELKQRTAGWGPAAVAYIFREDTDPPEPGERLNELVSAWMTFRYIAEFAASDQAADEVVTITNPLGAGANLVSNHGRLKVQISPFLRMLDGIEVNRIRLCPICKQLFWAGRRDKSGCSELCSHVLRQRSLRARQRENRKYKRRQELRKKKENRNG